MEQQIQQVPQQQQSAAAVEVDREFNSECLDAHNRYRDLHGCPPLKLSLQLASSAQAWANHLANLGTLKHSTPNPKGSYGENIAMKMVSGSREYKGSQCTAQWYSEIEMYDFNGGENQMQCGHFSQVVWKGTTEAGFGKAISPDGKMFAVGQYSPAGNFMNKWKANIPAPLSGTIQVPTKDDIMGQRPQGGSQQVQQPQKLQIQQQPQKQVTIGGPALSPATNQQRPSDAAVAPSGEEPQPTDPRDKPVGKATKTRIVNGEKSVTVTVTFVRPDGSRYQLAKETAESQSGGSQQEPRKQPQQLPDPELIVQPMRLRRNFAAPPSDATDGNGEGEGDADVDVREDSGDTAKKADEIAAVEGFADEMVQEQNQLRRRHGASDLIRSESLDRLAQAWAETLCQARGLRHCHPADYGNGQVGQNIARRPMGTVSGGKQAAHQLVHQWYEERGRFPFGEKEPEDIGGGHFSQMVWCSSEKLGIGIAVDQASGEQYTACFYYPCGNLIGYFAENVLPSYD